MSGDLPVSEKLLPPLERVLEALRADIAALPPGTRLPSQYALVKRHSVARATVQKALEVLRAEGLVVSTQGSGTFVADPAAPHVPSPRRPSPAGGVLPAIAALPEILDEAFTEPRIAIDYFGLTAETLNTCLGPILAAIRTGQRAAPEAIAVRLVLPSVDVRLGVHRNVADESDDRPLQRLRELIKAHALTLEHSLVSLRDDGIVDEVSVQVRTVPITPLHKIYLVNQACALLGLYEVVPHDVEYGAEKIRIVDVNGLESTLHAASQAELPSYRRWFEALWNNLARERKAAE